MRRKNSLINWVSDCAYLHRINDVIESSLTYDLKHASDKTGARLESTEVTIAILDKCNEDEVLLPGLLHRFYKLQVQIVYR